MDSTNNRTRSLSIACATLASILAFTWLFLIVRYNYGGNWTGLFCIGEQSAMPPLLSDQSLYRFPQSPGYDGQFYYYIAQDPLLEADSVQYVDNPPLRWRRILLPALAHLLAMGRKEFVAPAYIGIVLASVFLGTWWLSRFCQRLGYNALWGSCFLMIPGVAVSLDRMTVDVLLVALCIAFGFYGMAAPSWRIYPVLLFAPLARETGFILVLGFCLFCLLERRRREALLGMAMAVPWLTWALYLRIRLWPDGTPWMTAVPLGGLIKRILHPAQFEITGRWLAIAAVLDYAAVWGVFFALLTAGIFVWTRKTGLLELTSVVFALLAMYVGKGDVWGETYAFGRTMSPILVWPALLAASSRQWWMFLPLAFTVPRIGFQIMTVSIPIMHGLANDVVTLVRYASIAHSTTR